MFDDCNTGHSKSNTITPENTKKICTISIHFEGSPDPGRDMVYFWYKSERKFDWTVINPQNLQPIDFSDPPRFKTLSETIWDSFQVFMSAYAKGEALSALGALMTSVLKKSCEEDES